MSGFASLTICEIIQQGRAMGDEEQGRDPNYVSRYNTVMGTVSCCPEGLRLRRRGQSDRRAIASAFGINFPPQRAASGNSLPTTLGGIRVHRQDSTGDAAAPLLYVSPTQINYVMTSSDDSAFIGNSGTAASVTYAGLQMLAQGLDQLNMLLPGTGAASVAAPCKYRADRD